MQTTTKLFNDVHATDAHVNTQTVMWFKYIDNYHTWFHCHQVLEWVLIFIISNRKERHYNYVGKKLDDKRMTGKTRGKKTRTDLEHLTSWPWPSTGSSAASRWLVCARKLAAGSEEFRYAYENVPWIRHRRKCYGCTYGTHSLICADSCEFLG